MFGVLRVVIIKCLNIGFMIDFNYFVILFYRWLLLIRSIRINDVG